MTNYYPSTYAYASKFEPARLFAAQAEAQAFDRGFVAEQLAQLTREDFSRAFTVGRPGLRDLMRFAIEELESLATMSEEKPVKRA